MNYNKIVVSLLFVGLSSLIVGMDRELSPLVNPTTATKSCVENSPTSVIEINKDFFKQPKCVQRSQLGEFEWLTLGVVRHRRDSLIESNDSQSIPVAQIVASPEERFYPRRRSESRAVAIARPVSQNYDDRIDTICALLSRCLGIN